MSENATGRVRCAGAFCLDCKIEVVSIKEISYMLRNSLWALLVRGKRYQGSVFLCIGCVETRLGRRLDEHDFAELAVNLPDMPHSARLKDRLSGFDYWKGIAARRAQQEIHDMNKIRSGLDLTKRK